MRSNPINNYIIATERCYGGYALSTSTKALLRRDCTLSAKALEITLYVLEVLVGVLCVLELLTGVRRGGCGKLCTIYCRYYR